MKWRLRSISVLRRKILLSTRVLALEEYSWRFRNIKKDVSLFYNFLYAETICYIFHSTLLQKLVLKYSACIFVLWFDNMQCIITNILWFIEYSIMTAVFLLPYGAPWMHFMWYIILHYIWRTFSMWLAAFL